MPVGESFPHKVDVRVLSATNRDLRAEVARGNFRQDLYYRLAVFPISLPPLRERREDIAILAGHFLREAAQRQHKQVDGFDPEVVDLLAQFDWPGNVRELGNEIERAVALVRAGEAIAPRHLSTICKATPSMAPSLPRLEDLTTSLSTSVKETVVRLEGQNGSLRHVRATVEASYIGQVMREHGGNVSRAARALGLSRPALQKKIKLYQLR